MYPFQQALEQKQFGVISALLKRDEFNVDNAFKHTLYTQNTNPETMSKKMHSRQRDFVKNNFHLI